MIGCIEALLEHNFTCRDPLLDTIQKLSYEELTSDQGVGRGSIQNLLLHLIETEIYWMYTILGGNPEQENLDRAAYADIDAIRLKWKETESLTRSMFKDQNEETLQYVKNVRWGDRTVSFTVGKVFIHVATHEVHHRGLIIGLLRRLGYEPPDVNMI